MTPPSFGDLFRIFGRIGVLSLGGPAAQIALMHKELVDERPWLTEQQYLSALSFCMLLPGPEAMQLATYAGWRLRGVPGGLIAGLLFVIPGALVILALATGYAFLGQLPLVAAIFLGVKATVVVIVIEALIKVAKRALKGPEPLVIAGLAFLAIFAFSAPFPAIILAAALWGALRLGSVPVEDVASRPPVTGTLTTVVVWAAIWLLPLALLWLSGATLLTDIGVFFSKLAIVTFGGAYAVLAYMTQEVVNGFGWLTTPEMMDALGLAETTPGPLILVTEFVGFLAGFREGGLGLAIAAGIVTLWMTFAPCFLWIFAGAPYIERIEGRPRLKGALAGITAAVVGVILNLSLWFAAHVFFRDVGRIETGPLNLIAPTFASIDLWAVLLAIAAGLAIFVLHRGLVTTLSLAAAAGLGLGLAGLV